MRTSAPKYGSFNLVMYSVFGDESYDEKRERVFAIAGLFGDEDDWGRAEEAWTAKTGGKEVHATECERDDPRGLFKDLIQVLAKSKLFGFGVAMDLTNYDSIFNNAADEYLPYYICFTRVVDHFAEFASWMIPQDKVKFTFDQNLKVQYNAGAIYQYAAQVPDHEHLRFLADEISFSTRKNPRVQCADWWTREVMKHMDNTIVGPVRRPMRLSLIELRKTNRFGFTMYDHAYFEGLKRKIIAESGPPTGKYEAWRKNLGLQDSTSSRIRYEAEMGTLLQPKKSTS